MIEQQRETGFCHVTLCGRIVEKPIVADPPLVVAVQCPDGTYQVEARDGQARVLAGAKQGDIVLVRGQGKTHEWKLEANRQARSRLIIIADSAKVLDGRREECHAT